MDSIFNGCGGGSLIINNNVSSGGTSQWSNVANNIYVLSNVAIGSNVTTVSKLYVDGNVSINGTISSFTTSNLQSNISSLQTSNTLIWSNINAVQSNVNVLASNIALGGALSDETTTLTTSNFTNIRSPFPFTITRPPLFWLNVLPTASSNTVFDILKNGNTIYSVKPQIGSGTTSNVSANSIPGTLIGGSNSISAYDLLTIDVDTVGSGSPAGAKFIIFCS